MDNLTITLSGYGTAKKSYQIDFRPPCLAAPSWLMTDNMQISFRQNPDGQDIPILAYLVSTGLGIPRDAATGILVNGKPMITRDYILITLTPVKTREYMMQAVMKCGNSQVLGVDYTIYEDVVAVHGAVGGSSHNCEWLAGILAQAVERVEQMTIELPNVNN